ncbi:MAG: SGNH/GDSL hydrolase family protein [Kiritimatiellales bacterium]
MLQRSIVEQGNEDRLYNFFEKVRSGEPVTLGVIGGSITQGARASTMNQRYANRIAAWLSEKFPSSNVKLINAGIGGTGSNYGCLRVKDDLLKYNPDLVVIEFSVNDAALQDLSMPTYEGVVRQVLETPAAVLLLFTMCSVEPGTKNLEKILMPGTEPVFENGLIRGGNVQYWHAQIGHHYELPMISYRDAVWPEIAAGRLKWDDLMADRVHPSDRGHEIIANLIVSYLQGAFGSFNEIHWDKKINESQLPSCLVSDRFVRIDYRTAEVLEPIFMSGWKRETCYGRTMWTATKPGSEIQFQVNGTGVEAVLQTEVNRGGRVQFQVNELPPVVRSCQRSDWSLPVIIGLADSRKTEKWVVTIKTLPATTGDDSSVKLVGLAGLGY